MATAAEEYYSIFSVAYKLIVGFAAVGIINGVFMQLASTWINLVSKYWQALASSGKLRSARW
jgi:hypothetical protein